MDSQARVRLRQLQRHLEQLYRQAAQSASQQHRVALERLSEFEPDTTATVAQNEQQARLYIQQINRDTVHRDSWGRETSPGVIDSIVRDVSQASVSAGQAIANESQAIFIQGYQAETTNLNRQAAALGIFLAWRRYSQRDLRTVFGGSYIQYAASGVGFEQAMWQMLMDRSRSNDYFRIALQRLGATDPIATKIMNEFAAGIARGQGMPQLMRGIRNATDSARYRAMRIARTECLKSYNQGNMLGAYQAQYQHGLELNKTWHHTSGQENPRLMHEEIAGTTIPLDEYFVMSDGARLSYPLDSSAPVHHVVHCGCALSFKVVGMRTI